MAIEDHPLQSVVRKWLDLIQKAQEHKWNEFGITAWECDQFFNGSHDFMYKNAGTSVGLSVENDVKTSFRMTMNKTAELVRYFGPSMYFRNPNRQVNPQKPDIPDLAFASLDPQAAQTTQQQFAFEDATQEARASLLSWYLNYLPREQNSKLHSRHSIRDALVKGRGVKWTELWRPPGSSVVMPRSVYDSVDNLLLDPDGATIHFGPGGVTWCAKRCVHPAWMTEEEYGLQRGALKAAANAESVLQQATVDTAPHGDYYRKTGTTSDLITYWKIWSRGGLGHHLKQSSSDMALGGDEDSFRDALEEFGDNVYLVVADGIEYPLNLSPEIMDLDISIPDNMEFLKSRIRWPIPFWADDEWPFTELDFHPLDSPWPQAHMKPGLGELRLMNWIMSFLAGRIKWTSRQLIAVAEHAEEDLKEALEKGDDLTIIPLKHHMNKSIKDVIEILQFPPVQKDVWDILMQVMQIFDKRVALTELLYGTTGKQIRSATESQLKENQISIQPDDMAEAVETWESRIARKEAHCTRWFVGPESVAPVFNEAYSAENMQIGVRTNLWRQLVYVPLDYNNPATIDTVVREFDFSIEAGSIRKPNRERDQTNMDMIMQTMFPSLLQYYQTTGDPTQINALVLDWAKVYDFEPQKYLFPPLIMQPAPEEQGGGEQPSTIPMGA